MKILDITGQKFNRWTVLERASNCPKGQARWLCVCECGSRAVLKSVTVRTGHSKSCGCLKNELLVARSTKHGHSPEGHFTPTYQSWVGMVQRCTNPNAEGYSNYGARGITICERWLDFKNFLEDMGERPKDRTIDREDGNLGYFKDNCRWATLKTQARNKRNTVMLTLGAKTRPLQEWAELLGIRPTTLSWRLQTGMSHEEALTTPKRNPGPPKGFQRLP